MPRIPMARFPAWKRWFRWWVGALALALLASSLPALAGGLGQGAALVRVDAVDEQGVPVPWATVGSSWTPFPAAGNTSGFPRLQPADLQRLLGRNPAAWEYWNAFVRPVMFLRFTGLTDAAGTLVDAIDYGDAARAPWLAEVTVACGAYRDGYEPATAVVRVRAGDQNARVTLVLHRSERFRTVLPEYLKTFYAVRYELADARSNQEVSWANQRRLEGLRSRLVDAAGAAVAAGDREAAARILYWVAYAPEVQVRQGRLVGFAQENVESVRNCQALQQAADLDPANPHVQAQNLLVQLRCAMADERQGLRVWSDVKRLRRELFEKAMALDARAGDRLWPNFHDSLANDYSYFDRDAEAVRKWEWLRKDEPSWREADYYETLIRVSRESISAQAKERPE